ERVPDGVEDLISREQRRAVEMEDIELGLEAEHGLEAHLVAALELAAEDVAGERAERLATDELRVADEPRGRLGPRDDGGRLGIRDQPLVAVADLLVVERAGDDIRAGVEDGRAAVHVEPLLAV